MEGVDRAGTNRPARTDRAYRAYRSDRSHGSNRCHWTDRIDRSYWSVFNRHRSAWPDGSNRIDWSYWTNWGCVNGDRTNRWWHESGIG